MAMAQALASTLLQIECTVTFGLQPRLRTKPNRCRCASGVESSLAWPVPLGRRRGFPVRVSGDVCKRQNHTLGSARVLALFSIHAVCYDTGTQRCGSHARRRAARPQRAALIRDALLDVSGASHRVQNLGPQFSPMRCTRLLLPMYDRGSSADMHVQDLHALCVFSRISRAHDSTRAFCLWRHARMSDGTGCSCAAPNCASSSAPYGSRPGMLSEETSATSDIAA